MHGGTLRKKAIRIKREIKKGRAMADRTEKRTNPFSGQSVMLTEEEALLHDSVKQSEMTGNYKQMQKDLAKFAKLNASAYMTLLD